MIISFTPTNGMQCLVNYSNVPHAFKPHKNALREPWKILDRTHKLKWNHKYDAATTIINKMLILSPVHALKCLCSDGIGWKNSIFSPLHLHTRKKTTTTTTTNDFRWQLCILAFCFHLIARHLCIDINNTSKLEWNVFSSRSTTGLNILVSSVFVGLCDWLPSGRWCWWTFSLLSLLFALGLESTKNCLGN